MKVLHVLCDLSGGGAERLVLDLCRGASPGVEARVATVLAGGSLGPAFVAAGVSAQWVGRERGRPGGRALVRLARLARESDIVHTHLWAGHVWGRAAARLAGRPVISTLHNSRPDGRLRDRVERASRSQVAALVAVSEALATHLRSSGQDHPRLRVIPNGIDLSRFPLTPLPALPVAGEPLRLAAVGRFTEQKGFDLLLAALGELPGVHLELAGEGPQEARLRALAAPLGERVRFLGFQDDPADCMRAAHLVVVPSRWEGFGLVAAEAIACGRPVLAAGVDALPEVVGTSGQLFLGEDRAALVRALQDLQQHPGRLAEMATAAAEDRGRLDIRRTVDLTEALYEEVALGAGGR